MGIEFGGVQSTLDQFPVRYRNLQKIIIPNDHFKGTSTM